MDITSKFIIGSEEGIRQLFFLKNAQIRGMYENVASADELDHYLSEQLNHREAINDLNDLSTQLIVLFVGDEPAGYTILKNSFQRPEVLEGKKALHYSTFYILPEHDHPETRQSLWKKCLSAARTYEEAYWTETLQSDPLIPFFEECGFVIHEKSVMPPFQQPSVTLIKYNR